MLLVACAPRLCAADRMCSCTTRYWLHVIPEPLASELPKLSGCGNTVQVFRPAHEVDVSGVASQTFHALWCIISPPTVPPLLSQRRDHHPSLHASAQRLPCSCQHNRFVCILSLALCLLYWLMPDKLQHPGTINTSCRDELMVPEPRHLAVAWA